MKIKFIRIVLFLSLTAPISLMFFFFNHQKELIRREVKQQLISGTDKEKLVLLKFTKKESEQVLKWHNLKEFEYKGQLYDIAETVIKGKFIYYLCFPDRKETQLNKQINELIAIATGNHSQNKKKQDQFINFFKTLFFQKYQYRDFFISPSEERISAYLFNTDLTAYPPPVPPPEIN